MFIRNLDNHLPEYTISQWRPVRALPPIKWLLKELLLWTSLHYITLNRWGRNLPSLSGPYRWSLHRYLYITASSTAFACIQICRESGSIFPLSCATARPRSNWNSPAHIELLRRGWNFLIMLTTKNF
jgi:hypothetical protein